MAREDVLYYQVDDGELSPIRKDVFLIGRGSKCDLVLPHRSISREHAVITKERGGWFIEDLNSANGTWLDSEQVGKHKIAGGDIIHISNHGLTFTIRPG
jgi:pSer/pThr/pTyr-binding forkhead associated (FHA) protein